MSSPKTATVRRAKPAKPAGPKAPAVNPAAPATGGDPALSADAKRLGEAIERALAEGRPNALSEEAYQALMAALVRAYGAAADAGDDMLPLKGRGQVANTDIMVMASALLRSANLAVFELGMWQSWTGR